VDICLSRLARGRDVNAIEATARPRPEAVRPALRPTCKAHIVPIGKTRPFLPVVCYTGERPLFVQTRSGIQLRGSSALQGRQFSRQQPRSRSTKAEELAKCHYNAVSAAKLRNGNRCCQAGMPVSLTRPGANHQNLVPNWVESPRNSGYATLTFLELRRSIVHRAQDCDPRPVLRAYLCAISHKLTNAVRNQQRQNPGGTGASVTRLARGRPTAQRGFHRSLPPGELTPKLRSQLNVDFTFSVTPRK
jgi:hypothetical protein